VSPSSALTYTIRPSGLKIACLRILASHLDGERFALQCVSMKVTLFDCSLAAAIQRPSAERPTPSGETPSAIAPAVLRSLRLTRNEPIIRLVAHIQPVAGRGRAARLPPVCSVSTTMSVAVSMTLMLPEPSSRHRRTRRERQAWKQ